ncbi:Alanyl-tRNA synthetase [hydrothermal vent metagenome]|uniref:Alanine--tRNA ligase n=1 Tax=hydrothermal vent metagenome TaxID=652676 RepID=A0A3B1BWS1_9ZZZZ
MTLAHGMNLLAETIDSAKAKGASSISGEDAFKLYDTYGFPMDLATEIVEDAGMTIDMAGFNEQMTAQKEKARKSWKGAGPDTVSPVYAEAAKGVPDTVFTGYESPVSQTKVLAIIKNDEIVKSATEGYEVEILLEKTPFYAESGGQVSDRGVLSNESFRAVVSHVSKHKGNHWFHKAKIEIGSVETGDEVTAKIDEDRRQDIRRNHSATHLLHAALRQALGGHVKQAGSLVEDGRLRFDYTHFTAPGKSEIARIERMTNEKIMENLNIVTEEKDIEEATKAGAMALFGEKYGDRVRVVTMGDFSVELCGGTHTNSSGDIGLFKIISEGGVAAGVRRIEAVTGRGALDFVRELENERFAVGDALKSPAVDLPEKVGKLVDKTRELEKEVKRLKEKMTNMSSEVETFVTATKQIGDVTVTTYDLQNEDMEFIRGFIDNQRNEKKSSVVVAGSKQDGKALLAVGVTKDITEKIQAGKIIKEVAAMVGGGGGGRPDFAQAGGKSPEKLKEALQAVPSVIEKLLKN